MAFMLAETIIPAWSQAGHPLLPDTAIPPTEPSPLVSASCTQKQLTSRNFVWWRERLKIHKLRMHRKDWEWAFICQALHERNCLQQDKSGIGFAVGREGLPALFAAMGCHVLATDMPSEQAAQAGWVQSRQHCAEWDALNERGICPAEVFAQRVQFRPVDMLRLPDDLGSFDFLWSSCSMEHLGSLEAGMTFVMQSLRCLKPGGIAIHTTEFNCSSDDATLTTGPVVLYRKRDMRRLAERLLKKGHRCELSFPEGDGIADLHVQKPPFTHDIHLKLELGGFVATSFALVIEKSSQP
jgi:SAM-dependent methyltransferase